MYRKCGILILGWWGVVSMGQAGTVTVYPAPVGEELSREYSVKVEGKEVPAYVARVASADPKLRWKAMDDKARSADYFTNAAFAYFDMEGEVRVEVNCREIIQSAKILPSSLDLGIVRYAAEGKTLQFKMKEPKAVTVEVNGNWAGSLHIFANPPETNAAKAKDPNVIYFGPGIHEVKHLVVTNNQILYIAGGAVVRGVIGAEEPFRISSYSGLKTYSPTIVLKGTNIQVRGRGILDGSRCTTHARNLVLVQGRNIRMEGIILRDSSTWNVPIRESEGVTVRNVKVLGYRANSDGIDICNSRKVKVEGCFLRTLDDLVVVKTDQGRGAAGGIVVSNCVLWNEVAHALSIGAELREAVDDVVFTDCDVIHDKGREWTLRVYHCDSAWIRKVRFENLRIEESPRLISLWIGKAFWTRDNERGHIQGVEFKNIQASANPMRIELQGFDAEHAVEDVVFKDVVVNGKALGEKEVKRNGFVRGVRCNEK